MKLRVVALALAFAGCIPAIHGVAGQQITCAVDDDCPAGLACAENAGACVAPGPCVLAGGDAVTDGSPCGAGAVCVAGACTPKFCGDGVVDFAAGEQCDPRVDPRCRADCTKAACGDGVVDVGESCDSDRSDCVGCTVTCLVDAADCDGDASNGCECAPITVALPVPKVPTHALLTPSGAVVAVLDGATSELDVIAGAVLTSIDLPETGVKNVDVAAVADRVFVMIEGSFGTELFTLDGTTLAQTAAFAADAPRAFRFAVDADAFYVLARDTGTNADGVYRIDRDDAGHDTSPPRLLSGDCHIANFAQLAVCGDRVACSESARGLLVAIDRDTGESEVLDSATPGADGLGATFHPACVDDALVWQGRAAIFGVDGAGHKVALLALPQTGVGGLELSPFSSLVYDGAFALTVGTSAASTATFAMFRADVAHQSLAGIASGSLLDARDGRALGYESEREVLVFAGPTP